MNRFKDEQGRTWLVTTHMAKHLGISSGGLATYKYDGTLKRGVHWVQQTTGHKRVFYNKDLILEWYFGKTDPRKIDQRKPEQQKETTEPTQGKNATRIVSVYLQDDLHERLVCIQQATSMTVKKEIDGVVLQTTEEKPKLGTIVNMLLARAINDHFENRAA
jgi:hypothetical protein